MGSVCEFVGDKGPILFFCVWSSNCFSHLLKHYSLLYSLNIFVEDQPDELEMCEFVPVFSTQAHWPMRPSLKPVWWYFDFYTYSNVLYFKPMFPGLFVLFMVVLAMWGLFNSVWNFLSVKSIIWIFRGIVLSLEWHDHGHVTAGILPTQEHGLFSPLICVFVRFFCQYFMGLMY